MKKIFLIFCAAIFALVVSGLSASAEDCCVMKKASGCAYWNMTDYSFKELFCRNIAIWSIDITESALVHIDGTCADYPYNTSAQTSFCQAGSVEDGLQIPEFTTIAAGLALAGASAGYIYLRRKRVK